MNMRKYSFYFDYARKNSYLYIRIKTVKMDELKDIKKRIRSQIRTQKKTLGADVLINKSISVIEKIKSDINYNNASIVMLYHPLWDEVDTKPLIQHSLKMGKRVILPTVVGDDIIPVEITNDTKWEVGEYGILEPKADTYIGNIDLIIVPGVAFDSNNNRLGRGKGYYDRFLTKYPNSYKMGICFNFQLINSVPHEPFDLKMDAIIVE